MFKSNSTINDIGNKGTLAKEVNHSSQRVNSSDSDSVLLKINDMANAMIMQS